MPLFSSALFPLSFRCLFLLTSITSVQQQKTKNDDDGRASMSTKGTIEPIDLPCDLCVHIHLSLANLPQRIIFYESLTERQGVCSVGGSAVFPFFFLLSRFDSISALHHGQLAHALFSLSHPSLAFLPLSSSEAYHPFACLVYFFLIMSNWNSFSFVSERIRNTERTIPTHSLLLSLLKWRIISFSSPPSLKSCTLYHFDAWSIFGMTPLFLFFFNVHCVYSCNKGKVSPSQKGEDHLSTVVSYNPIRSLIMKAWHPTTATIWWPTGPLQPVKEVTAWAIGFICALPSWPLPTYLPTSDPPSMLHSSPPRVEDSIQNCIMSILTATVLLNS